MIIHQPASTVTNTTSATSVASPERLSQLKEKKRQLEETRRRSTATRVATAEASSSCSSRADNSGISSRKHTLTSEKKMERPSRKRPWCKVLFMGHAQQSNATLTSDTKDSPSHLHHHHDATVSSTCATMEDFIVEIPSLPQVLEASELSHDDSRTPPTCAYIATANTAEPRQDSQSAETTPNIPETSSNSSLQELRNKLRSVERANYGRRKDNINVAPQDDHHASKTEPAPQKVPLPPPPPPLTPTEPLSVEEAQHLSSLTPTEDERSNQQAQLEEPLPPASQTPPALLDTGVQVRQQAASCKELTKPDQKQAERRNTTVVVSEWTNLLLLGGWIGLALPPATVTGLFVSWMMYGYLYTTAQWFAYHIAQDDVQRLLRLLSKSWKRFGAEVKLVLEGNHSRQVLASMISYAAIKGQSPMRAFLRYQTSLVNRNMVKEYQQAINVFRRNKDESLFPSRKRQKEEKNK